ncbi:MAG: glycosyltransferase family 39 protein [Trichlorobacter sp.]
MERKDVQRTIAALGIYFLLQLFVRLLVSHGLELDEAEQLLLTQHLGLGYGSQPPLYTWMLSGLFALFGVNIFSLALLKNLLLFATYLLSYQAARSLGHTRSVASAAMVSLLFIPQIAWESQRDLTHSVLVVTLAAATIVCWLRLKRDQSVFNYLLVGLCWGAGLLGKYNFGIFLVSLLVASLSIVDYRTLLLSSRIFYSLGVMLAVVVPHAVWAATHVSTLLTSSGKFKQAAHQDYATSVLEGSGSLLQAVLAFSGPLLIVYGLLWYRYRRRTVPLRRPRQAANLLLRCVMVSLAICLLMVLVFQVTVFKDRWMQPILFFLPLALLPLVGPALSEQKVRMIRLLGAGVACLVLTGMAIRAQVAPAVGILTRFNLPYHELVAQLAPQVASADLVLAQSPLLGGTIRLQYPQTRVAVPGGPKLYHDQSPHHLLVVWHDDPGMKQPENLLNLVADMMGDQRLVVPYAPVQAPYNYLPGKIMQLSSMLIERPTPVVPLH